jgi:glycolate oxidase FAD binding subunit
MATTAPRGTATDSLETTGVTIRDAGPHDDVAGVRPRWVALPESTDEVAALMRASAAHDLAVVPAGGGSKLHWGRPPDRCDLLIDTCCLNEVVEHASGDLVARVQVGVTLAALSRALARQGQQLALDVPVEGTTVGGALATAVAGPRRLKYGTARDLLIGITVVLADGTIAKSGGKVVKNVAGYDLGKLFTGSYGTLGVITEATFRLHPLPTLRRWVTVGLPGPQHVQPLATALAADQAEPSAVELDWPDLGGPLTMSALVEGTACDDRARALQSLAGSIGPVGQECAISAEPPAWWGRPVGEETLFELRVLPAGVGDALLAVQEVAADGTAVRGAVASGVLAISPPAASASFVSSVRDRIDGRLVVLSAPAEFARQIDIWGETGALPLMRRVKERFDPERRMSPGRFVGGI